MTCRIVSPTGPPRCKMLAIGEAPGENEDRIGKAFVGKAGQLLDDYLGIAGLCRQDIRVTNLYCRWPGPGDPDPTEEQITSEIRVLWEEFRTCQPKYILFLGLVSARYFLGPKVTVELVHGQPLELLCCLRCGARHAPELGYFSRVVKENTDLLDLAESDRQRLRSSSIQRSNTPGSPGSLRAGYRGETPRAPGFRPPVQQHALREPDTPRICDISREQPANVTTDDDVSERPPSNRAECLPLPAAEAGHRREDTGYRVPGVRKSVSEKVLAGASQDNTGKKQGLLEQEQGQDKRRQESCSHTWTSYTALVAYHPASALREPLMSARCLWDLQQFAKLVKGTWKSEQAPNSSSVRKVLLAREEVKDTLIDRPCAIDTEGTAEKPVMMSLYFGGDVAYVVAAEDARYLRFGKDARAIYHYALYDLSVLKAMGVTPPPIFEDTAVKAFALPMEPQGLKPLAWRQLRMSMRSFDDVVRPHFNRVGRDWLKQAAALPWPTPKARFVTDGNGAEKLYKPQGFDKRAAGLLKSISKPDFELEKAWAKLDPELRAPAEAKLGPFPEFSIRHVPLPEAVNYAGDDAVATFRLDSVLDEKLGRELAPVVAQDTAFLPMVQRMQEVGLPVNVERAVAFSAELGEIVSSRRALIRRLTDKRVLNPGSDAQVAAWLFASDGGGMKAGRMTKGGTRPTTDDRVLSTIIYRDTTPPFVRKFCEAVNDYREAEKYKSTYVDSLIEKVPHEHSKEGPVGDICSRLHTNLRTTTVATGRLSSFDLNVLAMPTRTELGKRVRGLYEAPPGRLLLSCDASQLEVRLCADLSNDPELCRIYRENRDVYAETSIRLFGSDAERQTAKTLSLGILYGLGYKNYHERLQANGVFRFSQDDCKAHIDDWFKLYKGVKVFMDACAAHARKHGYVATRAGRRRYLPNCRLTNRELFYVRAEAERQAGNTPVQGGAADYVKRAGIRIWAWISGLRPGTVEPLLQIHDEFLLEVPEKNANKYGAVVRGLMSSTADKEWEYRVPVTARYVVARSWGELKA